MDIKRTSVFIVILAACVLIAGCKRNVQAIRDEAEKTRQVFNDVGTKLADAVPGATYQRLLMEANGSDKAKAKAAKDQIARLYGLVPEEFETPYVITVRLKTPGRDTTQPVSKPLRIGIAQIATNLQGSAELAIHSDRVQLAELSASSWRSPTREEIEDRVRRHVENATKILIGKHDIETHPAPGRLYKFPTGLLTQRRHTVMGSPSRVVENAVPYHGIKSINQEVDRYNQEIAGAITEAFSAIEIPASAPSYSEPWRFDRGSYLVVFVDEESWQSLGGMLEVEYLLHQQGDQNRTFRGTQWRTIPAARFTAHGDGSDVLLNADRLGAIPGKPLRVRWGTSNVQGDTVSLAYVEELATQMKVYATNSEAKEVEPWWVFWK